MTQIEHARPGRWTWLAWTALLLVAIVLPYILFGEALETRTLGWLQWARGNPALVAFVVAGLLASDIFLPIPSCVVGVASGALLGWVGGTLATWVGLSFGCVLGYAVGRWPGSALLPDTSIRGGYAAGRTAVTRRRAMALAATRAVPVLAEAAVIAAGAARMPFRAFLIATTGANFMVSLGYACIGTLLSVDATVAALVLTLLMAAVTLVATRWTGSAPSSQPAFRVGALRE